ncbi:MAG: hypothetical protein AAFY34_01875 [Pseudomonadota bacterium]
MPVSRLLFVLVLAACASPTAPDPQNAAPAITANELPDGTNAASDPLWQPADTGLLHIESGVTCPSIVADFAFTGEVAFPGQGPGRDVACNYIAETGGAIRLHITRFARTVSTDAYLKGSLETIKARYRQTVAINPPSSTPGRPITPSAAALRTDALSANRPGTPVDTALWIEQVGDWHIKIRATYEIDRTAAAATAVSTLFSAVRADLSDLTVY